MIYKSYKFMPNNEKLYNQKAEHNLFNSALTLDVEVSAESKRALFSELFPIGKIIEDSLLSSDFKYHESLIDTENPNIMKELIIVYKKNAEEPSPQVVKDIQDKIEKGNLKRDGIPQQYFLITITGRVCNR